MRITEITLCLLILTSSAHAGQCKKFINEDNWTTVCQQVANQHIAQHAGIYNFEIITGIQLAVETISSIYGQLDPFTMFQLCEWAIATAEQESFFRFAVGSAGEIGPYQFKLNTVRLVGKIYTLDVGTTDREIVENLLDNTMATYIFSLHFYNLLHRHKTLWRAWRSYNNGKHATQYANEIMHRYTRINALTQKYCHTQLTLAAK